MEFTTRIQIPFQKEGITYKNQILMLGSCFANEIGKQLKELWFNVEVNPFGTLYNPCSISASLERLCGNIEFCNENIIECSHGLYSSFSHHSVFADTNADKFLKEANIRLKNDSAFFGETDTLIITLGTSYVYKHIKTGLIVSNCHKIPTANFERFRLTVEEIKTELEKIIALSSGKKIIFTVSPIRHLKDGAHDNQISKSTLLLAIDEVITKHQTDRQICYFPSYEIMMDELRDYRFYATDMVHPSTLAIDYIFERFRESFISSSEYSIIKEVHGLKSALSHRPLFPQSYAWEKFTTKLHKDLETFTKKYPHIKTT